VKNPTDDALAQLRADWPNWQFWTVRRYIDGGLTWCCRRHDDHKRYLNSDSAEHLAEHLEDEADR
jgi:hypothetical protein